MSSGNKAWKEFLDQDDENKLVKLSRPEPAKGLSRRTFLEVLGYSSVALALSGCRAPQQKIVPYLKQPVEFTPGVASWFASVCGGCSASCGTLVKVRDGRPIKIEGNADHPLSQGGLCALSHGQVFGLYDPDRLRQPLIGTRPATWEQIDQQVVEKLAAIKKSGGKVCLLTGPINSPTSLAVIQKFLARFGDGKHLGFSAVSTDAIRQAHLRTHGVAAIPQYRFDKAKLVVSFDADFLGTWIAPVQFTRAYAKARDLREGRREMMRHVQFESRMSLTGSNADTRLKVSPAEQKLAVLYLTKLIAATNSDTLAFMNGRLSAFEPSQLSAKTRGVIERLAIELMKFPGDSLVLSGSNDTDEQSLINFINYAIGSYGNTLDLSSPYGANESSDAEIIQLVRQMNDGEIAALIISGVNPAYDFFDNHAFNSGLKRVPLKISLNSAQDETSSLADYVCPQSHFLEAWDDAEPVRGTFSINQPTIAPLFQTRAWQETLMRWSGDARSFHDVLRDCWREQLFPQQKQYLTFDEFWDQTLQKGFVALEPPARTVPGFKSDSVRDAIP